MFRELFGWASVALALAGCGSDATDGSKRVCEPGKSAACACVGAGDSGAQTCDADGNGWGVCECPGQDNGGASSAGGAGFAAAGSSGGGTRGVVLPGQTDPSLPPAASKGSGKQWNYQRSETECREGDCLVACPSDNFCRQGKCGAPCTVSVGDSWCCPIYWE